MRHYCKMLHNNSIPRNKKVKATKNFRLRIKPVDKIVYINANIA